MSNAEAIHVGFISTRFSGTDGVTLEAGKWADVLERVGYRSFWFAGELDRNPSTSQRVPEAHFQDPVNQAINEAVFGRVCRDAATTERIHFRRVLLKNALARFVDQFGIDLLIIENALAIPLQIPLGLAITEFLAETRIPAIAHHHDFSWERSRFQINAVDDYLRTAFPPALTNLRHVVINTEAREQLALRANVPAMVIPNVMDFEHLAPVDLDRANAFRMSVGLRPDDRMILQPTRVVRRKGIEHAIALVRRLNDPRCKLVITHEAGDEGLEYPDWLWGFARQQGVDVRLVAAPLRDPWAYGQSNGDQFSLWDIYPLADFVTFPSLYEGFGNAFLEAVYFRKPILINRYATYIRDIEPLGFDVVAMDGLLTDKQVEQVRDLLQNPHRRRAAVERNFVIARHHFSFSVLEQRLLAALDEAAGFLVRTDGTEATDQAKIHYLHPGPLPVHQPLRARRLPA